MKESVLTIRYSNSATITEVNLMTDQGNYREIQLDIQGMT